MATALWAILMALLTVAIGLYMKATLGHYLLASVILSALGGYLIGLGPQRPVLVGYFGAALSVLVSAPVLTLAGMPLMLGILEFVIPSVAAALASWLIVKRQLTGTSSAAAGPSLATGPRRRLSTLEQVLYTLVSAIGAAWLSSSRRLT